MMARYQVSCGHSRTRPVLGRLAGGLMAWNSAYGREYEAWEDWDEASLQAIDEAGL